MSAEIIDQANELAQRRLEMTIQNMRINYTAVSATRSAPGTGGGMPALR